ncbi:hypothetical protein Acife_2334 [Acidithiobacillus ferrivorans SS3]|uniref:Uncharacterized protein n=1 Tax=Acidithiobacillus ferrivorans SS3 TaxID=743299 RepID=G0JP25_9PROT|nr:outer membrane beta-barrel protein [Acidithiobacillus ferrivorans]AEM48440.1 hypothetical protein Acife_2334 [Acidithiobacillus ferrivorans SS3]
MQNKSYKTTFAALALTIGLSGVAEAEGFSMPPPLKFNAGPLGYLDVQGVLSGMGFAQTNPATSGGLAGKNFGAAMTNGLVSISKPTGLIRFSLTAGAYNYPSLGEPFASAAATTSDNSALPMAYLTIAPTKNFSVSIGKLSSLLGYTGTFTYQRMNIEGGFPWFLQYGFTHGIQLNYSYGPLSASVSWNDGYYTNRYNVISGLLTYSLNADNSLSIYADGNAAHTGRIASVNNYSTNGYVNSELALDNSDMYGIYYTYSAKSFALTSEVQYVVTPVNLAFGTTQSSNNISAMIHGDYYLSNHWSLAAGVDYEHSSSTGQAAVDGYYFGYGAGSSALGFMVTPTYSYNGYFLRDEVSYVHLTNYSNGFGANNRPNQIRDILETGFWF